MNAGDSSPSSKLMEDLISALLSLDPIIPFVFALRTPISSLPPPITTLIQANTSRCYFSSWVNQTLLLQHPATGIFLMHAGQR
ncbi:hypothetical protein BT69DRAFT_1279342, partial [Atractiella rhizophila]